MTEGLFKPSHRMLEVDAPIIPVIGQLIMAHPGTISLGQGVVFYGPPESALDAAKGFADQNLGHKYGAVEGQADLLKKIRHKLFIENGINVGPERALMVTAGANMAFLNTLFAITDPGDEVILPTPYYFNQEMAIRMLNGVPVFVKTDAHFHLDLAAIRKAITPKTRAVVTVSPNNPTGAVYSEASLRELNALCYEQGLYHISDEAYEYFTYGAKRHFSPGSIEGSEDHTISLFSLSKTYGFASWRIGYMVFPKRLRESILKAQDTNLICAPLISQAAALSALEAGKAYCESHLKRIAHVREKVLERLKNLDCLECMPEAEGAFYVFLNVKTTLSSWEVAERLIREFSVAVIPGSAFGCVDGCYLRVSYGALEPETALEGLDRLTKGLIVITSGSDK